jgi:deazaflavin-dependent oxidoreductase (nitroreductase family)
MLTTTDHATLPAGAASTAGTTRPARTTHSPNPPRSLMHRLVIALGPAGRPLAGRRWFPLYAVLRHTGRKSGTAYATPIVAFATADGFVIPRPFGEHTQWLHNLEAAGRGGIRWRGREHAIVAPELVTIDDQPVRAAVPLPLRAIARRLGIRTWVHVRSGD